MNETDPEFFSPDLFFAIDNGYTWVYTRIKREEV